MDPSSDIVRPGCLYVVATPIGNRADLGERARRVLQAVDLVAAEDTRHTRRLLSALGIEARLLSLHEHNERERVPGLIERLRAGESVAVVSDAGTPGLSDPGFPLVAAAHDAEVPVVPVPGPSAALAALAASGLATDRFVFEGFLPAKPKARRNRAAALAAESRTLVLYESAHRITEALRDLAAAFGASRPATLARELTKAWETIRRATLGELAEWVASDPDQRRGEIVLVIAGAPPEAADDARLGAMLDTLLAELPPARAAAVAARLAGVPRRRAYDLALAREGRVPRDDPGA